MNKLSLWLNCRTVWVEFFSFLVSQFYSLFYGERTVSCGTRAPAQAVLPASQGIQPADELAAHGAKAASGQVAQVVQQVVGQ